LNEGLNIIEKESDRLNVMVEELLDFSRFVSGKVTLKKQETDIREILEYIGKYMGLRAKRERINFKVIYEELPLIEIDKDRIKQVLINLLGNAFKFTPPGGDVILNAVKKEESILLSVKDTGCGISKEDLAHVKEKFYKGKNSKSQTGLGLSICDEIVQMHNGNLVIKSELEKGTEVIVSIPFKTNNKEEKDYETKI
jgi:signal transduction histidine kinase